MILNLIGNFIISAACIGGIYYNRDRLQNLCKDIGDRSSSLYTMIRLMSKYDNSFVDNLVLRYEIVKIIGYNNLGIPDDVTKILKLLFNYDDGSFKISDEIMDGLYRYDKYVIYYTLKLDDNKNYDNKNYDNHNNDNNLIGKDIYALVVSAKDINNYRMPNYSIQDLELGEGISWEDVWDEILTSDGSEISDINSIETILMHSGPLKDYYESITPGYANKTNWKYLTNYHNDSPIIADANGSIYITNMIGHGIYLK